MLMKFAVKQVQKILQTIDIRKSKQLYLTWSIFLVGYIILRGILGLHAELMYAYIALLLLCRFSFLRISITFFLLAMDTFLANASVEANNYMSYVFVFLVLCLINSYWNVIKKRVYV